MRQRRLLLLMSIVVLLTLSGAAGGGAAISDCFATPRASRAPNPDLAGLSHSWWLENRVWMGVAGAFKGEGFQALPQGQKIGWYRARPGALRIYGKRLDGPPADFTTDVPCCYGGGFQPSRIKFGAPGCWALTALVGRRASRFIVQVAPAD